MASNANETHDAVATSLPEAKTSGSGAYFTLPPEKQEALGSSLVIRPEFRAFINDVCGRMSLEFSEQLRQQRNITTLCRIVDSALSTTQMMTSRIPNLPAVKEFFDRKLPFSCLSGCSHCCQKSIVGVNTINTIYAAAFACRNLAPEVFESIQGRAFSQRWPCPMLVDGRCIIYEARPFVCRGWFSYDVSLCLAGIYNQLPENHPVESAYDQLIAHIHGSVERAVNTALAMNDLSNPILEFDRGLRIMFTVQDATEQWLNGVDVFADAKWSQPIPK